MMDRLIYTVVLCYCVSSVLITQSTAAIGDDCANGMACGGANEACESDICVCKPDFINNAGTCEEFDCNNGGCKNGGTCSANACACVTGWKGDDCGRATLGVDCSGVATTACTDVNNEVCGTGDKCACKPGFEDDSGTCKDIDECASNPCKNGGSCANGANAYTCTCAAGWTGTTCETDINECTAGTDDCDDTNAECGNTDGSFTCTCNSGFAGDGKTCTAFDCNNGGTCKNGGTCDAAPATACSCVTGWTGDDCEKATLGADCSGDATFCSESDANSECDADTKKCVCKSGFIDGGAGACSKAADNSAGRIVMAVLTVIVTIITTTNLF